MNQQPSASRIAFWRQITRQIDSHLGYRHSSGGPCLYIIESMQPEFQFEGLLDTGFMEAFFHAMDLVRRGTKVNYFLPHTTMALDRRFELWKPDFGGKYPDLRGYLTDELWNKLLDKAFTTEIFDLDGKALNASHRELIEARDLVTESDPRWGAMYLITRLFEATVVHVAWHHPTTRREIEREVGAEGGKELRKREQLAIEQAIDSYQRWRRIFDSLEDETETSSPRPVAKRTPVLQLIRGGK